MSEVSRPETETAALISQIDWYRRCLEDMQDGKVVRGLGEAKAGYDSAVDALSVALEAARQETVESHRIIDRIWCELGNPSYEELAGRTIYDRVAAGMAAESELAGLRETVGALSETLEVGHTFERMYQYSLGATWTVEHQQLLDAAQTAFIEAFADSLARLRASQENTRG